MKCVVFQQGEANLSKATVTLERDGMTLVIKGITANVCANHKEEYKENRTTVAFYNLEIKF